MQRYWGRPTTQTARGEARRATSTNTEVKLTDPCVNMIASWLSPSCVGPSAGVVMSFVLSYGSRSHAVMQYLAGTFREKGESYKTASCRYSCLAVKAPLSSPLAPLCTRHHTHEGGTDEEVLFWSWVGSHSSLISSMSSRHLTVKRLKSVGGATFTSTEA